MMNATTPARSTRPASAAGSASRLPETPTPLHCYNTGMSPLNCLCPTCMYYRSYYAAMSPQSHMMMPEVQPVFTPYGTPQHMNAAVMGMPVSSPMRVGLSNQAISPMRSSADVVSSVMGNIAATACTSSGRAMVQGLLFGGEPHIIAVVFEELIGDLEHVALDTHGCHVLRSLVDVLNDEQLAGLMASFNDTLILNMCTLSLHTRRVLQALFERQRIDLQPVVEVLAANAQYLAATQQGCISLIKIYQTCSHPQKAMLITPLLPTFVQMASDPFGNYVVQCAIEHSDRVTAARYVKDYLQGHLLELSCNKFASNVMEKVVSCVNVPVTRRIVVEELVYNPAAVAELVENAYGNFVLQSIIETCTASNEFKRICDRVRPLLQTSTYGSRIEIRIRNKRSLLQPPVTNGFATPSHAGARSEVTAVN